MKFEPGQLVKLCKREKRSTAEPGGWLKINEDDTKPLWEWIGVPEGSIFLYVKEYQNAFVNRVPVVIFEDKLVYMSTSDVEAYEP